MISRLHKTGHYYVFSPVSDLSAIAKGNAGELSAPTSAAKGRFADVQRTGGEVVGDEWAQQIVRVRPLLPHAEDKLTRRSRTEAASFCARE